MDRYRQIVELSGECIKEISLDGVVCDVNENGLKLLRAESATLVVGRPWAQMWPEDGRSAVEDAVAAARQGQRSEFEATCPDFLGEPRDWRVRVCPLLQDGQVSSILAVSADVTARNRAIQAAAYLQVALQREKEEASQREAGLVRDLESTASRLLATNMAYQQLEVMHHEATEGRRYATAAQQAAELIAEQAQKGEAVGQLLAGVVHDLNNFLQSAVSAVDLVMDSDELSERNTRYLRIAEAALSQGTDMSRRLIGFARRHPYQPEPVDLSRMVSDMLPLLSQAVGPKADLVIDTCESACCALVDRNTIERALLNLVINARDACQPNDCITITTGTVTVTPDASSALRAAGEYLTLTVTDTGSGMSDEVLSRLFDVYFTTKPVGEGSGLGLPQVHSAVRQAGGFITVTSTLGQGARFELALPKVAQD